MNSVAQIRQKIAEEAEQRLKAQEQTSTPNPAQCASDAMPLNESKTQQSLNTPVTIPLNSSTLEAEQTDETNQTAVNDIVKRTQLNHKENSSTTSKRLNKRNDHKTATNSPEPATLPLFSHMDSAMPNHLARSSLFSPIKAGERQIHEKTMLASRGDSSIYYTGHQLDMADNDVFLQALRVARGQQLGNNIYFNRAQFLRDIGRSVGKSQYEWLQDSFYRLTSGTVLVHTKRYKAALHLIDGYALDEKTGEYWLRMNPEIIKLFSHMEYALVDMRTRLRISRRQDMAKWLQNYVVTHEEGKEHVIGVHFLQLWSGSNGRLRDFQARSLTKALEELQRLGLICNVEMRPDGKVAWLRLPAESKATPFTELANTKPASDKLPATPPVESNALQTGSNPQIVENKPSLATSTHRPSAEPSQPPLFDEARPTK